MEVTCFRICQKKPASFNMLFIDRKEWKASWMGIWCPSSVPFPYGIGNIFHKLRKGHGSKLLLLVSAYCTTYHLHWACFRIFIPRHRIYFLKCNLLVSNLNPLIFMDNIIYLILLHLLFLFFFLLILHLFLILLLLLSYP